MTTRLADRLPPEDPRLTAFDATLGAVDYRKVAATTGRRASLSRQTERKYRRWRMLYQQWCAEKRYQSDLAFLTDAHAEEFIEYLVADVPDREPRRYTPNSVQQALAAMRYWADKSAVDPMPSFRAANGVLKSYKDFLVSHDAIKSRAECAILPERRE